MSRICHGGVTSCTLGALSAILELGGGGNDRPADRLSLNRNVHVTHFKVPGAARAERPYDFNRF